MIGIKCAAESFILIIKYDGVEIELQNFNHFVPVAVAMNMKLRVQRMMTIYFNQHNLYQAISKSGEQYLM